MALNEPNSNALMVAKDYPVDKFNLLIPVKTMQEISPMHKVVVNEVQIDPDPAKKDVYKEKTGELALTKKGLEKLMAAANIQIVDSRPIPTQKCSKCYEMAKVTRLAPRCFDCPHQDDIAYQVTVAVPEPSGTVRIIKATKEMRMSDEKARMSDAQYKQFFPYRTEQCESKALNRALRKGLMVSSTYKADDLKKPFAVALVVPNFTDPDMKAAMIKRYAAGESALFGNAGSSPAIESGQGDAPRLTTGNGTTIDMETGEVTMDGTVVEVEVMPPEETVASDNNSDNPPPWMQDQSVMTCEGCDQIIEASGNWSVEAIVDFSQKKFGKKLCPKCQKAGAKQ